jgi:hypothetical protein
MIHLCEDFVINDERFFQSILTFQCRTRCTVCTFNILHDVRLGARYVVNVLVGNINLQNTPVCAVLRINNPVLSKGFKNKNYTFATKAKWKNRPATSQNIQIRNYIKLNTNLLRTLFYLLLNAPTCFGFRC